MTLSVIWLMIKNAISGPLELLCTFCFADTRRSGMCRQLVTSFEFFAFSIVNGFWRISLIILQRQLWCPMRMEPRRTLQCLSRTFVSFYSGWTLWLPWYRMERHFLRGQGFNLETPGERSQKTSFGWTSLGTPLGQIWRTVQGTCHPSKH